MTRMSQNAGRRSSYTDRDTAISLLPQLGEFLTLCIDDDPTLLAEAYRLRYRVYCIERAFLRASDYPDGLETDEFDRYAKHFGTVDSAGRMVGTVRLVLPSILGLPLFRRCSVFSDETDLYSRCNAVAEISRLSVSQRHRPRARGNRESGKATRTDYVHARNDAAVFSLYRGVYQVSKRAGLTHWAMAAEASLLRALASYSLPFRLIGPEVDYFGPVAPYLLDLSVFDRIILSGTTPMLEGFLDGLEDPYRPRLSERRPGTGTCGVQKPLGLDVE